MVGKIPRLMQYVAAINGPRAHTVDDLAATRILMRAQQPHARQSTHLCNYVPVQLTWALEIRLNAASHLIKARNRRLIVTSSSLPDLSACRSLMHSVPIADDCQSSGESGSGPEPEGTTTKKAAAIVSGRRMVARGCVCCKRCCRQLAGGLKRAVWELLAFVPAVVLHCGASMCCMYDM